MARQTFAGLVCVYALGSTMASAAGSHVAGLVTSATDASLQITTTGRKTVTVSLDDKTGYMKWITHKPLQQDNRASRRSVAAGSCVDVELRENGDRVAKIVRINTDDAGTFDDPCKAIR